MVWQLVINAVVIALNPPTPEAEKMDELLTSTRTITPEEIERMESNEDVNKSSNWNKVRLGVRRDILYARVFNTSVRSGVKLGKLVRSAERSERSEEYYRLLGRQMSKKGGLSAKKD